jgi:FAD/FMN-containing dehydrogenase
VIALARWIPAAFMKVYYRWLLPWLVPRGWKVIDRSDRQLSMGHERFRHIETEIFVPRSKLAEALDFVSRVLRHAAGESVEMPQAFEGELAGWRPRWEELRSTYWHHYPICVRKVLPDEALLSMSSGDEPWYAISLISYARIDRRYGFCRVAQFLIDALARLYGSRPHWGKYGSLTKEQAEALYPDLGAFRAVAKAADPHGRFHSPGMEALLEYRL